MYSLTISNQHKLGADRVETFDAVPVDIKNRLKDLGPAREIEVRTQSQQVDFVLTCPNFDEGMDCF